MLDDGGRTNTPARDVRARPLLDHLIRLVLVSLLPLLVAATIAISLLAAEQGREFREGREGTAHALALALDAEIERLKPVLRTLAGSPTLSHAATEEELARVSERVTRYAREFGVAIWVRGPAPDRRWLLSTADMQTGLPVGPLPPDAEALVARSDASLLPMVGDLIDDSPVTGRPAVRLVMRIERDGEVLGIVGMAIEPERFRKVLAEQRLAESEFVTLSDGAFRVIASSVDHEGKLGRALPGQYRELLAGSQRGTISGPALNGRQTLISYARLPNTPEWIVSIGTPADLHRWSWLRPWLIFACGLAVSAGLAIGSGLALAHRLVRPLERIASSAEELAKEGFRAEPPVRSGSRVLEYDRLEQAVVSGQFNLEDRAAAARANAAALRSVLDSSTESIFVKDTEGRYRMVNRAAAEAIGRPEAEFIGRTDYELFGPLGEDYVRSDRQVIRTGLPVTFDTTVLGRPSEVARTFLVTKAPWRDPKTGEVLGLVGIAHDITERLSIETELRAAEERLAALARRATVSAMASSLAHELSQPITAALNYLHVGRYAQDRDKVAADAALEATGVELRRTSEILSAIRHFLRHDTSDRKPRDVGVLVDRAVRLATAGLPAEERCHVALDIEAGLPAVTVSRVGIEQVVVNLVHNAAQALAGLPSGGSEEVKVSVRKGADRTIAITVSDTGPGLPPEIACSPFEPFRSTKRGGTGIGLAICREIVEAHRGRVTLEGRTGGGTVVTVTLPADRDHSWENDG